MNIQKISLVFMFICIIALFVENRNMNNKFKSLENFGNDNIEHLSNTDEDRVRALIKEEYNHDIEAIRNLGAISKSLLTGKNYHNTSPTDLQNNTLTIPANVNTLGNFVVEGTFNLLPAGTIIIWVEQKIPNGWKMCNGDGTYTNVDGVTKKIPDLRGRFILGAGNCGNANTDLRDGGGSARYPGGHRYELNKTGGEYKHTLILNQIPSHMHDVKLRIGCDGNTNGNCNGPRGNHKNTLSNIGVDTNWRSSAHNWLYTENRPLMGTGITQENRGGNQAHNNMPPYYTVFYIIKVY